MLPTKNVRLGLRENLTQFILLIVVNAFVGGMLGLERITLPEIARATFGSFSDSIVFQLVLIFGISKAISNLLTAKILGRLGRKNTLLLGWLFALPIPLLFIESTSWLGLLLANLLLGIHQGLTWSTTVIMKMDLVGDKNRSFAMGLNEFAGYLSVALFGWLTVHLMDSGCTMDQIFHIGYFLIALSLIVVQFLIHDTRAHVQKESAASTLKRLENPFKDVSWRNKKLFSITHAGMANNLNDGVIWIVLPIALLQNSMEQSIPLGWLSLYPAIWGIGQLFTGAIGDKIEHRMLLTIGMVLQSLGLLVFVLPLDLSRIIIAQLFLGIGTALVYPNFISSIAKLTHPLDRTLALSTFRFWRDIGYAIGAVLAMVSLSHLHLTWIWILTALYTAFAGILLWRNLKPVPIKCIPWSEVESDLSADRALLIDVRTAEEYEVFHHPLSIQLPISHLVGANVQMESKQNVYTVCQAGGGRSNVAAQQLREMGYTRVWPICGGINAYAHQ